MKIRFLPKLSSLLIGLCAISVAATAQVYVTANGIVSIQNGDQMMGGTYQTDRSATPGFFVGIGTSNFSATVPDDTHNIDGYQQHQADAANQPYTFYVGSGTDLRTLAVSGTISATNKVATAWIAGNPSTVVDPTNSNATHDTTKVGTGITKVSGRGQWDWLDISNDAAGMTVTVSVPDMTGFTGSAADLRLVGWNGTQWINLSTGTAPYASALTENSTLVGTIPSGVTLQAIAVGTAAGGLDLTPRIQISPSIAHSTTDMDVTIDVWNLSTTTASSGTITLYVTKDAQLFNSPVMNAALSTGWTFNSTDPDYYIFTTTNAINADSKKTVVFKVTVKPGTTTGNVPVTVLIPSGSGGDTDDTNNSDDDVLSYYKN